MKTKEGGREFSRLLEYYLETDDVTLHHDIYNLIEFGSRELSFSYISADTYSLNTSLRKSTDEFFRACDSLKGCSQQRYSPHFIAY